MVDCIQYFNIIFFGKLKRKPAIDFALPTSVRATICYRVVEGIICTSLMDLITLYFNFDSVYYTTTFSTCVKTDMHCRFACIMTVQSNGFCFGFRGPHDSFFSSLHNMFGVGWENYVIHNKNLVLKTRKLVP